MPTPAALKQLKKNDFLAAVSVDPTTLDQVRADLTEQGFEFLDSYTDYLNEHFITNGRIIDNGDGTIQRKGSAGRTAGVNREVYQVRINDSAEYHLVKAEMQGNLDTEEELDEYGNVVGFGWSFTVNGAIKRASSHVFADYKQASAEVKALDTVEPSVVSYGQAETIEVTEEEVAATEYQ